MKIPLLLWLDRKQSYVFNVNKKNIEAIELKRPTLSLELRMNEAQFPKSKQTWAKKKK